VECGLRLTILKTIPKELLSCRIENLNEVLTGPTLLDIEGESEQTLFISTLLHGNETTSFLVLQKWLLQFQKTKPSKRLLIFLGNIAAAVRGLRQLPDGPDYNRIWESGPWPEHNLASEVFIYAKQFPLFANIDIHNNTGKNPFYACINVLSEEAIKLANLFSKKVVYFTEPSQVQSMAFAELCPSMTIEAGLPGNEVATNEVIRVLDCLMRRQSFHELSIDRDVQIYHTFGRIKIAHHASVDFEYSQDSQAELSFDCSLDDKNFEILPINSRLGFIKNPQVLTVIDNRGEEITDEIFSFNAGEIRTKQIIIPSMFTKNITIMKDDCLGYIMERMKI
jgi:succinylglutamate desuccinylase